RRRGEEMERAILRAAAEELSASGYAGMIMDRVARRAGTNKNAIYRRWPNRLALAVDAYAHMAEVPAPPPAVGNLRYEPLALLRRTNVTWSSPTGAILHELLAAAS